MYGSSYFTRSVTLSTFSLCMDTVLSHPPPPPPPCAQGKSMKKHKSRSWSIKGSSYIIFMKRKTTRLYNQHLRIPTKQRTMTLFHWPQCSIQSLWSEMSFEWSTHAWDTCIALLLIVSDTAALPWMRPIVGKVLHLDLGDNVVHIGWTLTTYLNCHHYY